MGTISVTRTRYNLRSAYLSAFFHLLVLCSCKKEPTEAAPTVIPVPAPSPLPSPVPPPAPVGESNAGFSASIEAEIGDLKGVTVQKTTDGKRTFVTGFDKASDSVSVSLQVPGDGAYGLDVVYRALAGDKTAEFEINDQTGPKVVLKDNKEFATAFVGRFFLKKGRNTIKLKSGWGFYDVDSFLVKAISDAPGDSTPDEDLVTKQPSASTLALWSYLRSVYGKKIIAGQVNAHAKEGEYIQDATGKVPAMGGFDLLHYSGSSYNKGKGDGQVDQAIRWHKDRKGIVTFVWHWFAPSGNISSEGKNFYTDQTNFDVSKAVVSGTRENLEVKADMKRIGDQLEILQKAKVPVIWRPLHEAEGKWFWWGAKGPEACKKLYSLLFTYLMVERKLDNLIWVWNSGDPAWYPGADKVDIISADLYFNAASGDPGVAAFDKLKALVGGRKMVALSENDSIPDPVMALALKAGWSWFNTWSGDIILTEKYNTKARLKSIYNDANVITLDELPDLRR